MGRHLKEVESFHRSRPDTCTEYYLLQHRPGTPKVCACIRQNAAPGGHQVIETVWCLECEWVYLVFP